MVLMARVFSPLTVSVRVVVSVSEDEQFSDTPTWFVLALRSVRRFECPHFRAPHDSSQRVAFMRMASRRRSVVATT